MIRIGICDDSYAFLQQTKFMIEHWDNRPQNISVEVFEDADALIHMHTKYPFDIILLDVVMPLLNGIEAARELREKDKFVKIVFLTSSSEYAVDSYTVKASNYLLKPVEPAKLFACLDELISNSESNSKSITIKGIDSTHRIKLSDIEFVESQGKYILFYISNVTPIKSPEPLYAFENKLTIGDGFFKCHRSFIVNIHKIRSYSSKEITVYSGYKVPISRNSHKDFESAYFTAIFEKAGANK